MKPQPKRSRSKRPAKVRIKPMLTAYGRVLEAIQFLNTEEQHRVLSASAVAVGCEIDWRRFYNQSKP